MVHHQRDAEKQHETVYPHPPGEPDQESALGSGDRLGHRHIQTEQESPELPLPEGKGSIVQVGNAQPVGEHKIPIESHERAQINGRADHQTRGRHDKHQAPRHAVVEKVPREDRQGGQRAFDDHPGGADGGTLLTGGQFPRIGGVRIQHRHHHDHGNAHGGDPTAIARRRIGMPEFVEHLDDGQAEGVQREATKGEKMQDGGREGVPLPRDQVQPDEPDAADRPGHGP